MENDFIRELFSFDGVIDLAENRTFFWGVSSFSISRQLNEHVNKSKSQFQTKGKIFEDGLNFISKLLAVALICCP